MTETCENCRYFTPQPRAAYGDCRAHPVYIVRAPGDWCGEWKHKPDGGVVSLEWFNSLPDAERERLTDEIGAARKAAWAKEWQLVPRPDDPSKQVPEHVADEISAEMGMEWTPTTEQVRDRHEAIADVLGFDKTPVYKPKAGDNATNRTHGAKDLAKVPENTAQDLPKVVK